MQRNRVLLAVGLLLAAAVVFTVALSLANASRPVPTPTIVPTATQEPATLTTCLGGQVFLRDAGVKQHLLESYNIQAEYVAVGSFEMKDADLNDIDCIWPGSRSAYEYFVANRPGLVRKHDVIFRTYAVIFTRADLYLEALLRSGLVYEKDGAYLMKMYPVLTAMNERRTWADIGLPEIAGRVNIRYSAPEKSSGGLQHVFMLANYLVPGGEEGGLVIAIEDLGPILPQLVANWEMQPRQVESSPEWFAAYVYESGSIPLAASSESLYLGWLNALPSARRETDGDLIVGIYPEWTVSTDHVLAGLTPEGDRLVEIFQTDAYLQELGWDNYGMRTAAGGIAARPGDTDVTWLMANPLSVGEPKQDVFEAVKAVIK
jgi:hypothetical protein